MSKALKLQDGLRAISDAKVDEWVARISEAWRGSVVGIIETGRMILEAKRALPHGHFLPMVRQRLPFSERVAQALMKIAKDGRLSQPEILRVLPPSWGTLIEIQKISGARLAGLVEQGKIRPDMERKEVLALRDNRQPKPVRHYVPATVFGQDVRRWSIAEARRAHALLTEIIASAGAASDGASIGEVLTDAHLLRMAEGRK